MQEADACIKCGSCLRACPITAIAGERAYPGPRAIAVDAPRFSSNLEWLRDPLQLCTTCSKCLEACPSRLDLPQSIIRMRGELYRPGDLRDGHARLVRNIDMHRRAVEPIDPRVGWKARKKGSVLYFPGCIEGERLSTACRDTLRLLDKEGGNPFVPPSWACCGSPLEKIGDMARLKKMIEANRPLMEGRDSVVTSCPGCTVQLSKNYGIQPLHTIEFLYESVGLKRMKWKAPPGHLRVALHHPCHLVRSVGAHVMDYAHEILSSIPGVTVVEMEEEDACCGGGGGVASSRPSLASSLASLKMRRAREAGASLVLAPCPFCVVNLKKVGEAEEFVSFLSAHLR